MAYIVYTVSVTLIVMKNTVFKRLLLLLSLLQIC